MITIIAEKPSVAQSIAAVVGAVKRENGYLSGNGYSVTWAFGHLMELAPPQAYGFEGGWGESSLPIIPEKFKIQPIGLKDKKSNALYASQLKTIATLFKKSEKIIVATDAGREGELIFRYIYSFLNLKDGIRTPFMRLWISSLTDKAIKEGMRQLRPGSDYDNMYAAGKARSEADWLIGINGTRATTINVNDSTNYKTNKKPVRMDYLDDIDIEEFREITTYKRMCICILRNDHVCKYMGFALSKEENEIKNNTLKKYKHIKFYLGGVK